MVGDIAFEIGFLLGIFVGMVMFDFDLLTINSHNIEATIAQEKLDVVKYAYRRSS